MLFNCHCRRWLNIIGISYPERSMQKLTVIVMYDLKVFDGSLRHPAMEVEDVGLGVVVPHRGLVVQLNHTLCALILPSRQQGFMVLQSMGRWDRCEWGLTLH